MIEDTISVKLVVVGDACVGKTCVLISYTEDRFPTDYVPTVFDNYACVTKVEGRSINLSLWDTAGQQQYNRLRSLAYSNCDVFLIVFSIIDPNSFHNSINKWYIELQENIPNVPKIFVGNKQDLRAEYTQRYGKESVIQKQNAERIIEQKFGPGNSYFECSALTRRGIRNIFQEAIKMVIQGKIPHKIQKKQKPNLQPRQCACNLI